MKTMTQNLISVVMPCYNRASLINKSIESVLNQTYRDLELIVVDDGSTDNSLQVLEAIHEKDNRVKVISQAHKGPYPARNRGLKEAKGEFVAFLDSDDTWDLSFLEKLHKALLDNPDAALAYCGWQNIGFNWRTNKPFIPPDYQARPDKIEVFLQGNRWPIHVALTRRKIIDEAGGFSERWLSCGDYDLWLRIAAFHKIALVPEVLAYYFYHGAQISKNRLRADLTILQIKRFFLKQHPEMLNQIGRRRVMELTYGVLFRPLLLKSRLPWRLSNAIELALERKIRKAMPPLYRLIRFGRFGNITRPLTYGPRHHFFGYYDKCPWNASASLLLAHEVNFNDRPPNPDDYATIGVVKLREGNRFEPLAKTNAWNWQQGSMLQWHSSEKEGTFLYNDKRQGRFVGVAHSVEKGEVGTYERPFYAVSPGGDYALSLNFSRLHTYRPGYGYAGIPDAWAQVKCPQDDGIYLVDLKTGTSRLIVSLHQLANYQPVDTMKDAFHWVNHIQIDTKGNRFAFFHFWGPWEDDSGRMRMYTAGLDGSGLNCLLDGQTISHYDWKDEHSILAWVGQSGTRGRFILCDSRGGPKQVVGEGLLMEDGHCSFSPDRKRILCDTYPDRHQLRTLYIFNPMTNKKTDLERFYSPKEISGEIRCDLHPRWSRDGKQICIDSAHTGQRQMYVIGLKGYIR
jgi:glycosyltransferase involved in cell wall biosynthesis